MSRIIFTFLLLIAVFSCAYVTAFSAELPQTKPIASSSNIEFIPIPKLENTSTNQGFETPEVTKDINSTIVEIPAQASQEEKAKSNPSTSQTTQTKSASNQPVIKNIVEGPTISIPDIGIQNRRVDYATVTQMNNLDLKLLYNPILETVLASDFCTNNANSYLMGHSEPPSKDKVNYPAANIFARLNELKPGQIIQATNQAGTSCTYQITQSFKVTTDKDGFVAQSVFDDLFTPQTNGKSLLTIQTCQKGSTTVRIIYRAERID